MTARIYSRVLVPLDGSLAAEFAIRFAADLASQNDADLLLLYLRHLPARVGSAESPEESDSENLEQIHKYLADVRKEQRDAGVRAQDHLLEGHDLAGALFKFVESERVSIIVMSTQGRTAMLRGLFGSSIEKTLNNMPVPLLLVRPMYQQIVVPLDGSKWSESAIPRAAELARVHDAELVLLHVYQSKSADYAGQWVLAGQQQIAEQSYEQMADQIIALRNRLRQEGLRAREVLIRGGNPAQVICDFVETEEGISMIVMSTHGRTGLSRWLVGSVAQTVIKNSRSPVTLVRPDR
jgi:nucleotide-binding universal stress UspA family protein